jgi:transitional endoplasmic reticulum ATPase
LYRGKAIRIRFRDDDGDIIQLPHPEFIDTSKALPGKLIFSKHIEEMIESNLFIPITRVDDCIANSIKVKRGILLGGKYGTGKTLAASVAAHLAEKHGITYVYTPRANELSDAIAFAKQYQSPACVVFCEDIDRAVFGDRSVKMDDILNILDGIDTKSHRIITVLTTNHLENINQAMLRPGRLDAIINVEAPDAEAAQRLVRMYGGGAIPLTEDLTAVGVILNGQIPAVIEETVKRAKLYQLGKTPRGGAVTGLTADAILTAAKTMATQIDLLREKKEDKKITMDGVLKGLVNEALGEYYD